MDRLNLLLFNNPQKSKENLKNSNHLPYTKTFLNILQFTKQKEEVEKENKRVQQKGMSSMLHTSQDPSIM